jgi:hypothetical protein
VSQAAAFDPERALESAALLEEKAVNLEAKAAALEADAAACDETKLVGRLDAKNKRSMAKRYRDDAQQKRHRARVFRDAAGTPEGPTEQMATEPSSPQTPRAQIDRAETATGLAEQLTRLAELRESGALSDDEFSAAKQRLLG